jgi:uncharacterized protein YceK
MRRSSLILLVLALLVVGLSGCSRTRSATGDSRLVAPTMTTKAARTQVYLDDSRYLRHWP